MAYHIFLPLLFSLNMESEYCQNAVHLLHSVCFLFKESDVSFQILSVSAVFSGMLLPQLAQVSINVRVSLECVLEIRAARQCALQTFR